MMDLPLGALGRESASIAYNVIDFALLVFHCVGSAITKQGNCAMHTAKTKRDDFQINLKSSLSRFWTLRATPCFIIALKSAVDAKTTRKVEILRCRSSYNKLNLVKTE